MTTPDAAWYPDPHDPTRIRWWDGAAWTENVRDRPDAAPAPAPQPAAEQAGFATSPEPMASTTSVDTLEPLPPIQADFGAQPAAAAPPSAFAHEASPAWPVGPVETAPPVMPDLSDVMTPPAELEPEPPAARDLLPPTPVDNTATNGAPSIGASRLPPLRAPTPAAAPDGSTTTPVPALPTMFDTTESKTRKPLRLVLLVGIVLAATVLGVAAYSTGMFDSVTGQGAREPSSDTVEVVQGTGYSAEIPKDWAQTEAPNANVELAFVAPNGATLALSRSEEETEADFTNSVVRQVAFDAMVRVQQALIPGLEVVGRVPTTVDGAQAEQVTFVGTLPSGESYTMVEIVAIQGQAPYVIALGGTPELVGDPTVKAQFEAIVSSFKFD